MKTLAQRIKHFRKAKGLSQQSLAHACGWESQSRIGNYERGIREPNLADIEKMASALKITLGELLPGSTPAEAPPSVNITFARRALEGAVPVVGYAQLGTDGYFEALDFPTGHGDGYLNIHSDDPDAYGLKVTGDSMHPRIKNGEYVLVEPSKSYYSGDEVLVRTTHGRTMIKEFIYLRDGMYRFDSVNADHAPIHVDEDEIEHIHLVGGILKSSRFMHSSKK